MPVPMSQTMKVKRMILVSVFFDILYLTTLHAPNYYWTANGGSLPELSKITANGLITPHTTFYRSWRPNY
jgi:hypothetical protein